MEKNFIAEGRVEISTSDLHNKSIVIEGIRDTKGNGGIVK